MNNLSRFDRNKILINSEKNNILLPSSLYFQKHKNFTSNNHEETKANFVINKNNNNNNFNSYSIKNSKGFNLMFEYKNNIAKKKKTQLFFNNMNEDSFLNKQTKLNEDIKYDKNEEDKMGKNYNYKKVNMNIISARNSEINPAFNKRVNNVNSKYYSNNKIYVKMRQNLSINFNLNSPNKASNINTNNIGGGNKKLDKQYKSANNSKVKNQSYTNINKINDNYKNDTEYEVNRYSLGNKQIYNKYSNQRNSDFYLNIPSASNTYLNTENNINSRNISTKKLNNIHNKNYNLMNIDYSTERNNTYSNINNNKYIYENSFKRVYSQKSKYRGNSNQCKNIKYTFRTKDSYICTDYKTDKVSLKNYYDHEFNEIRNVKEENYIDKKENECKFNNEDISYKECLSTNYSTCTNEINKIKEKKNPILIQNKYNYSNLKNKCQDNVEMFHFFMVSYLQKGKKLGNKFN